METYNEISLRQIKIYFFGKEEQIVVDHKSTLYQIKEIITNQFQINFQKYELVYKLKTYSDNDNDLILKNILLDDDHPSFILRKKESLSKNNNYDTSVILENFPSFMDVSQQIKAFCNLSPNEIDFHVDYKNNWCRISFNEAEYAFSFISFIDKARWSNPLYKRLKVNMDYKKTKTISKVFLSQNTNSSKSTKHSDTLGVIQTTGNDNPVKIAPKKSFIIDLIPSCIKLTERNSISINKHVKNNRLPKMRSKNNYNSDIDQSDYLMSNEPYQTYREIKKKEDKNDKSKWISRNGFMSNVGQYSLNQLKIRRKNLSRITNLSGL